MMPAFQPEPRYLSKEAKYVTFNFHREDQIRRLVDLLSQSRRPARPVIVLSGEAGIGRTYFLESALHRTASAGTRIRLITLDLQGLEPQEPSAFEQYAKQQLERL